MGRFRNFALVCASTLSIAPVALAEQSAGVGANAAGEIVVTAQKREERLLDVPISITAATAAQLEQSGIVSTRDLTALAPGLNAATQGFAFQPSIRGVGTTSTTLGDETNVSLYIDNVYIPFQAGNAFNLKNIQRIEVLKGPQGTLFGRNATGGAIRIVTADPSFDPGGVISVDYGTKLRSTEVNGYVTAPLSDNLAVALSAYTYDDEGYVRNIGPRGGKVADSEQVTLRGKILFKPSDRLKVVVSADHTNNISSASFSTTIQNGVQAFKTLAGAIVPPDKRIDPYTVALTFDPYVKSLSSGGSVNVQWDMASHTLTSISAYRDFHLKAYLDSDRTNLDAAQFWIFQNTKVFTQEFDLASNFKGPVNYVAGLYYYDSKAEAPKTLNFAAPAAVVGGVRQLTGGLVNNANTQGGMDARSWAAFGELTWQATDKLSVIGGYRYTWEKKEAFARNALSGVRFSGEDDWTNSSLRITGKYQIAPTTNVYATYSTGFKSGTFNATAVTNPLQKVNPEEVKAYEVGLKSRVGQMTILASAFSYDYNDIQLQVNNILNPVAGTTILQNAARAKIEGADLQIGADLTENFSAQLGVSWLPTARYDQFVGGLNFIPNAGGIGATPVATNLSGTRMIRTPETTFDFGLTYSGQFQGGALKASAKYFWSDSFIWVPGGAVKQEAYDTLNARVAWTTPDDRYTLSLWGRNLGEEVYWLQAGANSGGFSGSYAQPREIGFGVNAKF
ncbi:MAG: TonB-dependent receptor [Caulobacterales bacterium]